MRKRGEVVGAFPGVVMSAALSDDVDAWLRSIHLWSPVPWLLAALRHNVGAGA